MASPTKDASADRIGPSRSWKTRRGRPHAPSRNPLAVGMSPPQPEGRRWPAASVLVGREYCAAGLPQSWRVADVHRPTMAQSVTISAKIAVASEWMPPILDGTSPVLPQNERRPAGRHRLPRRRGRTRRGVVHDGRLATGVPVGGSSAADTRGGGASGEIRFVGLPMLLAPCFLPEAPVAPAFRQRLMGSIHGHGPICTVKPCG